MSVHNPVVEWCGRKIHLEQEYYVYFPEPAIKRELTKKQMEDYRKLQALPDNLRMQFTSRMNFKDPAGNPNITPMLGRDMMDFALKWNLIPLFDVGQNFEIERRLTLTQTEAFDFFEEHSKMLNDKARRGHL